MPRVKAWTELPRWLQDRLRWEWQNLTIKEGGRLEDRPTIGDPEYRVYRVGGSEWWAVDSGADGVTLERERGSIAYDDLPEGELKALVDAEGRACRATAHIEVLHGLIVDNGVEPRALERLLAEWRGDGLSDDRVVVNLAGVLHDGLVYGNWPR